MYKQYLLSSTCHPAIAWGCPMPTGQIQRVQRRLAGIVQSMAQKPNRKSRRAQLK